MSEPFVVWTVGEVTITKVTEIELPGMEIAVPLATAENVADLEWLHPHFLDGSGEPLGSVHALLVRSGDRRIIVDTCLGNDKPRPLPAWDHLSTPFESLLAEADFAPEDVDTVVCTHLHVDHVGWNTKLVDGRWVPTFPNARYLFAAPEWEHWRTGPDPMSAQVLVDSLQPVVDAGLVDLVSTDHALDGSVRLESTPGHTPGHVSVRISSGEDEAVITGDLMHHPCQVAHPDWTSIADSDQSAAIDTRTRFVHDRAADGALVIGTHFAGATAGRVIAEGAGDHRFETA